MPRFLRIFTFFYFFLPFLLLQTKTFAEEVNTNNVTAIPTSLEDINETPEVIVEIPIPIEIPTITHVPTPTSTPTPNQFPVVIPEPIFIPTPTPTPNRTCPTGYELNCNSELSTLTQINAASNQECDCVEIQDNNECKYFEFKVQATTDNYYGDSMIDSQSDLDPRDISCLNKIAIECKNENWELRSSLQNQNVDLENRVDAQSDMCISRRIASHYAQDYLSINHERIREEIAAEIYGRLNEIQPQINLANQCVSPCNAECRFDTCAQYRLSMMDDEQKQQLDSCIESCELTCDSNCETTTGHSYKTLKKEEGLLYIRASDELHNITSFSGGSVVFDMSCNVVENFDQKDFCGTIFTKYTVSPISLILDTNYNLDTETSIVNFKLDLSKEKNWTLWKGSAQSPLLVYDPEHKGIITSPTQLFGNWTFGGKVLANVDAKSKDARPWNHGFEALASLDLNNDKEISGVELNDLALWFDNNRNAISEPGEVRNLNSSGIVKLFYTPDAVLSNSADIVATRGFERTVEGKTIVGKSIDWYGELHNSPEEALVINSFEYDKGKELNITHLSSEGSNVNSKISGLWVWESKDGQINKNTFGMFNLKQKEKTLDGVTFVEIPVAKNNDNIRTVLNTSPINGEVFINKDGQTEITFKVKNKNSITLSSAILVGKELIGKSKTTFINEVRKTSLEYGWKAKRF